MRTEVDVLIVGGGPTGLFLATLLRKQDISCIVLEKQSTPSTHSRSIGIHPPSLERLGNIGVVEALIQHGIKVHSGRAFYDGVEKGSFSFSSCPPPFDFVLTVPQFVTESVLTKALVTIDPNCLYMGFGVNSVVDQGEYVDVVAEGPDHKHRFRARIVVGCDGKNSVVRAEAKIDFKGQDYPDVYTMGDFKDDSSLGSDAGIFLGKPGLVESFPLPNQVRRWVAKVPSYIDNPAPDQLVSEIAGRTGTQVEAASCTMISSFKVSRYMASSFYSNRIVLAGDAAHVVSPIGGQGMNLGWLDAHLLSNVLGSVFSDGHVDDRGLSKALSHYSRSRIRATKKAQKRSELNMWFGRAHGSSWSRLAAISAIISRPIQPFFARLFTMRGLE